MLTKPQNAASQDKNYLSALAPIIVMTIFTFQTKAYAMAMGPYIDLSEKRLITNTWSQASKTKSAEDKNIDAGDDQANQDNVREVIPLWETKSLNHRSWSEHIYNELPTLGPELLTVNPVDAKIFCPNFSNLSKSERKQFWAFFISSMSKFESGFDPNESYTENFKDSRHKYIVSRGLLQISIESSKGYRCGFTTERELHNPAKNLSCGIKILNHWMKKDNRIASRLGLGWRGGARYWAVLRQSRKQSYQSIVKWSNALPFCKL
ncbi:MAG: transglycosylase SLT domain-containing protein [Bdellovibrionota bacterium]